MKREADTIYGGGSSQIIINFIATLDYNNFTSIYHFSDKFDKIETMLNNWIKSDKKRFL